MERIELQGVLPNVFAHRREGAWSWVFERGKVCRVDAVSGGGKSSLCSFLYGYRADYQGVICFDDCDIRAFGKAKWTALRRENLAIAMQDLRLFPELTALENVLLKSRLTGCLEDREIVDIFERLGIGEKANQPVARLSFGQQQRVAFVRTLAQRADFLILDEPISHLDEANAESMSEVLCEHLARSGAGAIVTSIGKHFQSMKWDKILTLC